MKKCVEILSEVMSACAASDGFIKIDTFSYIGSKMPFIDSKPCDFRTYDNNLGMSFQNTATTLACRTTKKSKPFENVA